MGNHEEQTTNIISIGLLQCEREPIYQAPQIACMGTLEDTNSDIINKFYLPVHIGFSGTFGFAYTGCMSHV